MTEINAKMYVNCEADRGPGPGVLTLVGYTGAVERGSMTQVVLTRPDDSTIKFDVSLKDLQEAINVMKGLK